MSDTAEISPAAQFSLSSLQATAAAILECKRRLGQFAVIWRNNEPVLVGGNAEEERDRLLEDKKFIEQSLARLSESSPDINRAALISRLHGIESFLALLPNEHL
jgi:hypothetical protein